MRNKVTITKNKVAILRYKVTIQKNKYKIDTKSEIWDMKLQYRKTEIIQNK